MVRNERSETQLRWLTRNAYCGDRSHMYVRHDYWDLSRPKWCSLHYVVCLGPFTKSSITCYEFIVENIYCRCGFLQRAVSFVYTTLQKHAVTLYETSRNAPLNYDFHATRMSANATRCCNFIHSWSTYNTTSHNMALRYCTFTIYTVALTRQLFITYWRSARLRANKTKPLLYVIETESCVKLWYSKTVLLFCDNSWACCIKNECIKNPINRGFKLFYSFNNFMFLFLFRIGHVVKLSFNLYKLFSRSTPRNLAEFTLHYWWMICADNFIIFDPWVQLRGEWGDMKIMQ